MYIEYDYVYVFASGYVIVSAFVYAAVCENTDVFAFVIAVVYAFSYNIASDYVCYHVYAYAFVYVCALVYSYAYI